MPTSGMRRHLNKSTKKTRKLNPISQASWNLRGIPEKGRTPTVHIYYIGTMISGILYIERGTFGWRLGTLYSEHSIDALILYILQKINLHLLHYVVLNIVT